VNEILHKYLKLLNDHSSAAKSALSIKISSGFKAHEKASALEEGCEKGWILKTKIPPSEANPRGLTVFSITEEGRQALEEREKFFEDLLTNQVR
jgi:hypothetical protein